ncbi:hypothetical protein HYU89_04770 [Candidatus Collierbacteria bacterium]|nr:hypothetical protein [Candidatus Collierbacteria bacterium]
MQSFTARVSEHQLIAGSFQYLHLELVNPDKIEFQAGQYLILTVEAAKGIRRNYSIASRPEMSHAVELLVDVKPQGSGSQYLKNLKPGEQVKFVAPFGNFVVQDACVNHQLLFVATGSGISPIRSMILDLLITKKHQGPIRLWWGMRRQEDCFWVEDFDNLEKEYQNFKWDLILSRPPKNWPLHFGHVTQHLIEYTKQSTINPAKPRTVWYRAKRDPRQSRDNQQSTMCFYLCGNKFMIEELSTKLAEVGINKEHIHTEKFF